MWRVLRERLTLSSGGAPFCAFKLVAPQHFNACGRLRTNGATIVPVRRWRESDGRGRQKLLHEITIRL